MPFLCAFVLFIFMAQSRIYGKTQCNHPVEARPEYRGRARSECEQYLIICFRARWAKINIFVFFCVDVKVWTYYLHFLNVKMAGMPKLCSDSREASLECTCAKRWCPGATHIVSTPRDVHAALFRPFLEHFWLFIFKKFQRTFLKKVEHTFFRYGPWEYGNIARTNSNSLNHPEKSLVCGLGFFAFLWVSVFIRLVRYEKIFISRKNI